MVFRARQQGWPASGGDQASEQQHPWVLRPAAGVQQAQYKPSIQNTEKHREKLKQKVMNIGDTQFFILRTYIYNSLKPNETVPVQKISLITAIIVQKFIHF